MNRKQKTTAGLIMIAVLLIGGTAFAGVAYSKLQKQTEEKTDQDAGKGKASTSESEESDTKQPAESVKTSGADVSSEENSLSGQQGLDKDGMTADETAADGTAVKGAAADGTPAEGTAATEESNSADAGQPAGNELPEENTENIFEAMPTGFDFLSGAGGWRTHMELAKDGTFTGLYQDSDMGGRGEGYQKGTVYICSFSGKFTQPQKIGDYTYSMKLESIQQEGITGDMYYEDDIRYIYSDPYGLNDADEFLIYCPGIALSQLPQGFINWIHSFVDVRTEQTLPYYGIYNVNGEMGFVGGGL